MDMVGSGRKLPPMPHVSYEALLWSKHINEKYVTLKFHTIPVTSCSHIPRCATSMSWRGVTGIVRRPPFLGGKEEWGLRRCRHCCCRALLCRIALGWHALSTKKEICLTPPSTPKVFLFLDRSHHPSDYSHSKPTRSPPRKFRAPTGHC